MALNFLNGNGHYTGKFNAGLTAPDQMELGKLQERLMDPKIYQMRANYASFVVFLSLLGMKRAAKAIGRGNYATGSKRVNCTSPKFEWADEDIGMSSFRVTTAVSANNTRELVCTTAGVIPSLQAGMLLYVPKNKEILRISSVDAATNKAVVCGGWGTPAQSSSSKIQGAIATTDDILIMSTAFGEGTDAALPQRFDANEHHNYCQIFKKSTKNTGTNEATKYYGDINKIAHQKKILFDQFLLEKSRAYFLGRMSATTLPEDSNTVIRTTSGLDEFISTNRFVSSKDSFSYIKLMEFIKAVYEYGGDERLFVCNPAMMLELQRIFKGDSSVHIELSPKSKEFGIDIRRILTFAGAMDIMIDKTMGEIYSNPVGYALETDCLEEMVLRPDRWQENIQSPSWDYRIDQIMCETGLKVVTEKRHGRIELLSSITDSTNDGREDSNTGAGAGQDIII